MFVRLNNIKLFRAYLKVSLQIQPITYHKANRVAKSLPELWPKSNWAAGKINPDKRLIDCSRAERTI